MLSVTAAANHAMRDKPTQPLWLCNFAALGFHCADEPLVVFLAGHWAGQRSAAMLDVMS